MVSWFLETTFWFAVLRRGDTCWPSWVSRVFLNPCSPGFDAHLKMGVGTGTPSVRNSTSGRERFKTRESVGFVLLWTPSCLGMRRPGRTLLLLGAVSSSVNRISTRCWNSLVSRLGYFTTVFVVNLLYFYTSSLH